MSKFDFLKRAGAGVLLMNFIFVSAGKADQVERASKLVSAVKQIVRGEGRFDKFDVGDQKFAAGRRIAQLAGMKSPEGVAGLIDVILDPDFIEFDRKYARTNNGAYRKMEINDPYTGLMVKAVWRLLNQPLVDQAAISTVMLDKSKEIRLHSAYVMDHNVMVEDCSDWCLEVQAGRMTFQMKGDPIRYNRFGKKASRYNLPKRGRNPEGRKQDEGSSSHEQHEDKPAIWIYAILVVGIAGGLALLAKRNAMVP